MKKYILTERAWKIRDTKKGSFGAGTKAMQDVEKIVLEHGFEPAVIYRYSEGTSTLAHVLNQLWTFASWMKLAGKVKKDDLLLIQCPLHRRQTGRKIAQKRINAKAHVVSLIHDIEELRALTEVVNKNDAEDFELTLHSGEFIIAHNYAMKEYLISKGFDKNKIIELELFDYLTDSEPARKEHSSDGAIAIAGNCSKEKSAYLYNLQNIQWDFELYGLNYDITVKESNIHYNGAVEAGKLPCVINGSYGLIWDGKKITTCTGNTGNYMKYNNPHKTSLYAAAGLPVIIWKEAAMAKFVRENMIGITVDSLEEINQVLKNMSEDEYKKMEENVWMVSEKVRGGFFILNAIKKIEKMISTNME